MSPSIPGLTELLAAIPTRVRTQLQVNIVDVSLEIDREVDPAVGADLGLPLPSSRVVFKELLPCKCHVVWRGVVSGWKLDGSTRRH